MRYKNTWALSPTFLHRKDTKSRQGTNLCSCLQGVSESFSRGTCQHHELQSSDERMLLKSAWDLWLGSHGASLLHNRGFFFFMQLLLQRCPAISDYYGGWKTLLFLTAGSGLNGLKRIFRSSCFREASQTVVTTVKSVCLCFGDSAFLRHWYCLALSNERLSPFSLNVVNYLLPFIQTMKQQISKKYLLSYQEKNNSRASGREYLSV